MPPITPSLGMKRRDLSLQDAGRAKTALEALFVRRDLRWKSLSSGLSQLRKSAMPKKKILPKNRFHAANLTNWIVFQYRRVSRALNRLFSPVANFEADVALQQSGGKRRDYDAINLKVPPAREAENWEAGRNPALPPQRWWS